MRYIEAAEARDMPGLRLALSINVPGPWGESAKKIFEVKGIPYAPVAQYPGAPNGDLAAWTGKRNAPVAIYENEPARSGWAEILMLAERLRPEPALLPKDSAERAAVFGISNEICGEWGFGWARRLRIIPINRRHMPAPAEYAESGKQIMRDYGMQDKTETEGSARAADILRMLTRRLQTQEAAGSPYFVGHELRACDIHWACFSAMLDPLPHEVNPMPAYLRDSYSNLDPLTAAAKDPILIRHRDFIFDRHLGLPLDY